MTTQQINVLVVGAGPVGTFLGAVLAAQSLAVQVWERRTDSPAGSRAIGIHPPSLDALAIIGAAEPVLAQAALVREGVALSRGRRLGSLSFAAASATHPYVATLDQHRTEAILRERLAAADPCALHSGTSLIGLQPRDDVVEVTGTRPGGAPTQLRASFVIGADGPHSTVRSLLGIASTGRDYPDRYAMGDFADPEHSSLRASALVDVGPAGVVEAFPLPGGRRRYVAISGREGALRAPGWRPDAAIDRDAASALAAVIRERTGARVDPASCTMLSGFGARRRVAARSGVGRVALIGDAAHEVSPIGGQGMNLGWLDAAELAPLLVDAVRTGASVPWRTFARRRVLVARRAALQAEANMALGRPLGSLGQRAREAALCTALALPTSGLLARAYSMRWS